MSQGAPKPQFPATSSHAAAISGGTFALFAKRMQEIRQQGRLIPLHLGDTWKRPPAEALSGLKDALEAEGAHLYQTVPGMPQLRERLAARHRVGERRIHVTPGATGGLSVACHTLFEPGDEVLVLTPSWPLIFGILHSVGVTPKEVDFTGCEAQELQRVLENARSEATAGIYFSNPNNPTGRVWSRPELEAILQVARQAGLWVIVDEAYRDLVFDGHEYVDITELPGGDERVVAACTFSKSYALAGHRVGYLVSPVALLPGIRKLLTHTSYHTARASQELALGALDAPSGYVGELCATYQRAARMTREELDLPALEPGGGYYFFFDLSELCTDRGASSRFLSEVLEEGVSLAPGWAFGSRYATWTRLCFTSVKPERLQQGLEKLAAVVARWRARTSPHR